MERSIRTRRIVAHFVSEITFFLVASVLFWIGYRIALRFGGAAAASSIGWGYFVFAFSKAIPHKLHLRRFAKNLHPLFVTIF